MAQSDIPISCSLPHFSLSLMHSLAGRFSCDKLVSRIGTFQCFPVLRLIKVCIISSLCKELVSVRDKLINQYHSFGVTTKEIQFLLENRFDII